MIIYPADDMGLDMRKPVFVGLRTTQAQTSLRCLISPFAISFLEKIISELATSEMSIFYLVPVAEETGLSLLFSEPPKTGFLAMSPISSTNKINHLSQQMNHLSCYADDSVVEHIDHL